MITIKTKDNGQYIFKNGDFTVKTLFTNWKIWLTQNEIAEIYWVSKKDVEIEISNILINSRIDLSQNIQKIYNEKKDRVVTYFSLDILLLLWYRSKHFKETKFLVNTNKILREFTNSRQYRTDKTNSIFKKIINYFHQVA